MPVYVLTLLISSVPGWFFRRLPAPLITPLTSPSIMRAAAAGQNRAIVARGAQIDAILKIQGSIGVTIAKREAAVTGNERCDVPGNSRASAAEIDEFIASESGEAAAGRELHLTGERGVIAQRPCK